MINHVETIPRNIGQLSMAYIIFHTQLWFPVSERDFWWFESDFRGFCQLNTGKDHCGRNSIHHGRPCVTQFTLVSLYSTEITRYFHVISGINSFGWNPFHTGAHDGFSMDLWHMLSRAVSTQIIYYKLLKLPNSVFFNFSLFCSRLILYPALLMKCHSIFYHQSYWNCSLSQLPAITQCDFNGVLS